MLSDVLVGAFILAMLAGFIFKDLYEQRRFKRSMDRIRVTPLIALGRLAFYALFVEMAFFGTVLALGVTGWPALYALTISVPLEPAIKLIGMALMAVGVAISFWSLLQIDGRELALTGPYRYLRHPIYLSCSMVAIGFFLAVLHLAALFPLLIVPAQAKMADAEEDILAARFGGRYEDYRRATGKMMPSLRRPR